MKDKVIKTIIERVPEAGMVSENMLLADIEGWDSMAVLTVMAALSEDGIQIDGSKLPECQTVGDFVKLASYA